ncbi:uncharacterized protein LOC144148413 [Haemaphysalis longicornis]
MDRHCDWVFKKYGHVRIPDEFELPSEQNIGPLAGGENHANATEVILKDSATILLKKLNYDGQVPGAYFAVKPRPGAEQPEVTRLDDENSTNHTLKSYSNKDVTLLLPEGHHWNEYESFNLYSFDAGASFAHVNIRPEVAERLPVHRPTSYSPVVHGNGLTPLYNVPDDEVRSALLPYGPVIDIGRERWRVKGINEKDSTTRSVPLKLNAGVGIDDLPRMSSRLRVARRSWLCPAGARSAYAARRRGT